MTGLPVKTETLGIEQKTPIDMSAVPEHLRPREYGKKELMPLPVSALIRVSQQRGNSNPAFASIKESIANGDLINSPDVALLTPEAFSEYLTFINKLWKNDHHIAQYQPDDNGYYYLVIAGHTRVDAVDEIEKDREKAAINAGFDPYDWPVATIDCKVHVGLSPEEILALQMDENLHEKPSQERTAIAMVETYFYGLEQGKWSSKKEFIEKNDGKFSQDALNAALVFCDLDEITRGFVFTGTVAYGPVVELGKTVEPHRNYLAREFFGVQIYDELSPELREEIDQEIITWNAVEIACMQKKRMNITACKARYKSLIDNWLKASSQEEAQQSMFMSDPTREWRDRRAKTRSELRSRVKEVAALPASGAFKALQLHVEVMGPDSEEGAEMLELLESGMNKFERKLAEVVHGSGNAALFGATA